MNSVVLARGKDGEIDITADGLLVMDVVECEGECSYLASDLGKCICRTDEGMETDRRFFLLVDEHSRSFYTFVENHSL